MTKQITIGKIFFNAQNKQGQAYISKKNGQPYKLVNLYSSDFPKGTPSANGFAFQDSDVNNWKPGDRVWVELVSREYQGKTYWDFKPANEFVVRLMDIEARVKELEEAVFVSDEEVKPKKSEEQKLADDIENMGGEVDPFDVPF